MKRALIVYFSFLFVSSTNKTFAWGPEGHAMVGRLAMRFVKEDVRKNILSILGKMPIDTAANWMDIMKSNSDYDFMRIWHYVDFPKGEHYVANNNENLVNQLINTYRELNHKKTLCSEQIKTDLFILLHLMGDLHMPLHTGYEEDLGGNKKMIRYDTIKTHNLHTYWDVDIIRLTNITDDDCMKYFNSRLDTVKTVDFIGWMNDTRPLLKDVYDFPDSTLDKAYLLKNKLVVEKQLLKAALRLALVLNKLFYTPAQLANFKRLTARYNNGIDVNDSKNNLGKMVTVCSRVASIRSTSTITQISLGEPYPNNPITIIVFAKNYSKFKYSLEEMLEEKNVCIKGLIEDFKGKPQIVVDDPENIIIL